MNSIVSPSCHVGNFFAGSNRQEVEHTDTSGVSGYECLDLKYEMVQIPGFPYQFIKFHAFDFLIIEISHNFRNSTPCTNPAQIVCG